MSCLAPSLLHSQDSITLQLVPTLKHPAFETVFLVNGSYAVKSYEKLPEKFAPRFHYLIQPAQLRSNNGFSRITSLTDQWLNSQFVTIPKKDTQTVFPYFIHQLMDSTDKHAFEDFMIRESLFRDSVTYNFYERKTEYLDDYVKYNGYIADRYKDVAWRKISDFVMENPEYIDSIEQLKTTYRAEHYQTYVDSLLQPFYMGQTEITNAQYREFIHYLRDSIATALLYQHLGPIDGWYLTNVPKNNRSIVAQMPEKEIIAEYGYNFDYIKNHPEVFQNENFIPVFKSMYYPQPERFYIRREWDVRQFNYVYPDGTSINCYPDTLVWWKDSTFKDFEALASMYFWHPAYDNYPVVGLSIQQQLAYCSWKTRQLNYYSNDKSIQYRVALPQVFHYEMALKTGLSKNFLNEVDANTRHFLTYKRSPEAAFAHIQRVAISPEHVLLKNRESEKFKKWLYAHYTSPIYDLLSSVAETSSVLPLNRQSETALQLGGHRSLGIVDPEENSFNTLFYQEIIGSQSSSSCRGFRTIVYVTKSR
ncbi:MAG: SUMF1/EgtB/PvdO family nonheme iron enzyme [Fluviicola sp.]|nr:SUMF1/EgtB/PvdO family nonheme iron enzyme [Fluviicola sp.]